MKKVMKGTFALLLALLLMLSTIVPTFAAEQPTPDVSPWAVGELSEGERYGIFPMEWYFEGFRGEISAERLEELLSLTEEKIATLGLMKKDDFTPAAINGGTTRGEIITRLYNIIAQYDFPVGDSPLAYMQERGVIKGSSKGLELDVNAITEHAVIFATRFVQDTYFQVQAGAKGVAWKVENNGNLVYLLGSIHIGSYDLYPFNEKLVKAFHESDVLFVEANLFDQEGLLYYQQQSLFEDGTSIKDIVSKETYEKLVQVSEKYGIPVEALASYKPWYLASLFSTLSMSEASGKAPEELATLGIDMYFLINALLTGKPILELEGVKAQTNMFDGLSIEAQEEYLAEILDSILEGSTEMELLDEWFGHWVNGDIEGFAKSFNALEGEASEFNEMLFGERDLNMAAQIMQLLELEEKGTYFIVVGAGHFLTEESILFHLKEKGYKVELFYE